MGYCRLLTMKIAIRIKSELMPKKGDLVILRYLKSNKIKITCLKYLP